jgi:predicted nucleic acid-binding protein
MKLGKAFHTFRAETLRISPYPHYALLQQIWQLRHNLSAYDAAYVALAEKLGATLVTRDAKIAASSQAAEIEVY